MAFNPSNQSDFTVTVEDWGQFVATTAIKVSGESRKVFDGGSVDPYTVGSRATAAPFTVSRVFDRGRELNRHKKYLPLVNGVFLTVTIQPTDRQLQRDGDRYSARCLLTGMTLINGTSNSDRNGTGSDAMIELDFSPNKWDVLG